MGEKNNNPMYSKTKAKMRKKRNEKVRKYFKYIWNEYQSISYKEHLVVKSVTQTKTEGGYEILEQIKYEYRNCCGIVVVSLEEKSSFYALVYNPRFCYANIVKFVYDKGIQKFSLSPKAILANKELVNKMIKEANETRLLNRQEKVKLKLTPEGFIEIRNTCYY